MGHVLLVTLDESRGPSGRKAELLPLIENGVVQRREMLDLRKE
jgi:hypothetical protein